MTTPSVSVRPAAAGDAAAIRDIYAPIVCETTISFESRPPDTAEIARRMTAGQLRMPWLVAQVPQASAATPTPLRTAADRHTAGRWRLPFTSLPSRGGAARARPYQCLRADLR